MAIRKAGIAMIKVIQSLANHAVLTKSLSLYRYDWEMPANEATVANIKIKQDEIAKILRISKYAHLCVRHCQR